MTRSWRRPKSTVARLPASCRSESGKPRSSVGSRSPSKHQQENFNTEIKGYHADVYYNPTTGPTAERLRDAILSRLAVRPGAFSNEPIGPHPLSQFSVVFRTEEFQNVVPWLMLNRQDLDVLVHR